MTTRISLIIASSLMLFRPQQDCMKARLVTQSWYSATNVIKDGNTEVKEAKLFIRNTSKEEIKLPQWLYEGIADDTDTEIYLEIMQKAENGAFVESEKNVVDYQIITDGRKFDTIKPGKEAEISIQLDFIYKLNTKGKYKVRAILRLKSFTDCSEKVTSWQEFEIR